MRNQPTGAASVDGTFHVGAPSALNGGALTFSGAHWSKVGRAGLTARLSSGNYLGSGLSSAYGTGGNWQCASEGGTCTIPPGTTASVSFDAGGANIFFRHGLSGNVPCTRAFFGDPNPLAGKICWLFLESGVHNSSAGPLLSRPHHLALTTRPACGSLSYSGQPLTATVTARNAGGATTLNYDGSVGTSPNFAKAVTLALAAANASGSLSGAALGASAFDRGVGSTSSVAFGFTNKLTSPQTIALRAIDADGVSSSGFAEGSMALRSGRLRLSNATGSARAALQIPVVAEYWANQAWATNSADNCTVVNAPAVAVSNRRDAAGAASAASTTAGGFALTGGSASLLLAAPRPAGSSLSVDLAINLGSSNSDQSCLPIHPASTGAALPWLRSAGGACAATADRDPAARATIGITSPETRRVVHVRDIF